jgi:hypothetical protein
VSRHTPGCGAPHPGAVPGAQRVKKTLAFNVFTGRPPSLSPGRAFPFFLRVLCLLRCLLFHASVQQKRGNNSLLASVETGPRSAMPLSLLVPRGARADAGLDDVIVTLDSIFSAAHDEA